MVKAAGTSEPADIARLTGLPYQTIKNYLNGRLPEADKLIRIADSTNVSIHWLLTGEGPMEREIIKSIKDGAVDIEHLKRDALIKYYLSQAQMLTKEEEQARSKSDGLKQAVNGY